MFKYVVALATGSESDRAVAATAARALDPASSHIAFVHVRMDVEQMMLRMAGGGLAIAGSITDLQQKANDTERRARENFQAACSELSMTTGDAPGPGVSASWTMGIGEEAEELATFGRASDAVVLSRKRDTPLGALDVLEAALLETGRPILIAPTNPPPTLLKRVAIAWKNTPEAARAVSAATPLIARAEEVVIFCAAEAKAEEDPSGRRLQKALGWHNKQVRLQYLARGSQGAAETLMRAASEEEAPASLLVMGGYSHTRLREAVFGGFTRTVLASAEIPVLMAH